VEQQIEEVEKNLVEKGPSEPRKKKDPKDLETPPPDEVAARCGNCHYPLREGEEKCPKCQKEVVWS
jgi:rubrerythrin